jgi:site-specific recombinase XerD
MECLRLRVKDVDLTSNQIVVRAGKGDKDQHAMLPTAVKEPLAKHLDLVKRQHQRDLERGLGRVALPNALGRKYPNGIRLQPIRTVQELLGHCDVSTTLDAKFLSFISSIIFSRNAPIKNPPWI